MAAITSSDSSVSSSLTQKADSSSAGAKVNSAPEEKEKDTKETASTDAVVISTGSKAQESKSSLSSDVAQAEPEEDPSKLSAKLSSDQSGEASASAPAPTSEEQSSSKLDKVA